MTSLLFLHMADDDVVEDGVSMILGSLPEVSLTLIVPAAVSDKMADLAYEHETTLDAVLIALLYHALPDTVPLLKNVEALAVLESLEYKQSQARIREDTDV